MHLVGMAFFLFSSPLLSSPLFANIHLSDLREGVTDESLCALASAGCGENLTELALLFEGFVLVCRLLLCGSRKRSGSGSIVCVCL